MSVNKVILVGNVGRDPEIRHLDKGVAVARFSLATTENYTSKTGEKVSNTEWHNVVAWRGLAEVVEKYVKKGSQLYIEGRLRTRDYDKDGVKHYATEINADTMQLLGRREGQTETVGQPMQTESVQSVNEPDFSQPEEDDLPF
ncbi:single-stranded DNA-binding protein [Aquipluma nitroreducens]|uniref:Single-stranded DNA-binding protein n=1 Tax=Aquipluma nitroreducens TaxID=2010828 RepID=A0A5K7SC88_9BACT|nr:single-stranded DNA-binding protein [Aquipluma nitroreducens]BBE19077.1 single-stranded DNA-binding protein [Aquipluma nitroreducens]